MIIFSSTKNKNWNGSGISIKDSYIEFSSNSFIDQEVNMKPGKYNLKIIGNSISGNGIIKVSISLNKEEVLLKTVSFKNKINTESIFSFEVEESSNYKIRIWRDKDCIGRVYLNLINIIKILEKKEELIKIITDDKSSSNFILIDYDRLTNPTEISSMFSVISERKNIIFLIKVTDSFVSSGPNYRLFFEWDDLFDFISLFEKNKLLYIDGNIDNFIFKKYNVDVTSLEKLNIKKTEKIKISGLTF